MSKCDWMDDREVSAGVLHTVLGTMLQKRCGPNGGTLQRLKRLTADCDHHGKQTKKPK